jgi:RES domain-containing protein
MPVIWRIAKEKHTKSALSGEGARLYGGRWNSPGTPMIYAAQSQSLAILEILVHLDSTDLLMKYVLLGLEVDESFIRNVEAAQLPENWKADPVPSEVQAVGDAWSVRGESVILSVPSALVPDESNYLINPNHPDFGRVRVSKTVSYLFDQRFARKHG